MRHRLPMSQKFTTCALERFANEMNWCHAGRYLFAHNSSGSTISTRPRNSTACRRIDPRPMGCELVWTSLIGTSRTPRDVRFRAAVGAKRTASCTVPIYEYTPLFGPFRNDGGEIARINWTPRQPGRGLARPDRLPDNRGDDYFFLAPLPQPAFFFPEASTHRQSLRPLHANSSLSSVQAGLCRSDCLVCADTLLNDAASRTAAATLTIPRVSDSSGDLRLKFQFLLLGRLA
jgi:hypothetical protein